MSDEPKPLTSERDEAMHDAFLDKPYTPEEAEAIKRGRFDEMRHGFFGGVRAERSRVTAIVEKIEGLERFETNMCDFPLMDASSVLELLKELK